MCSSDLLGIRNLPNVEVKKNLLKLAEKLEEVRSLFGHPLVITSGYRCLEVNRAIGSKDNSQHCLGQAADFHIDGYSIDEIIQKIIDSGIEFDQLIHEFDSWVHLSISDHPRRNVLIIDKKGTRQWKQ